MTEKSQPRERSRLGLTPSIVPAAIFPLMIVIIGVLAVSIRLTLAVLGVALILFALGFVFPKSQPYWQRHLGGRFRSSRPLLIAVGVILALGWLALGTLHLNHPKIFP